MFEKKSSKKVKAKSAAMKVRRSEIEKLLAEKKFKKVSQKLKEESAKIKKVLESKKLIKSEQNPIALNNSIFNLSRVPPH